MEAICDFLRGSWFSKLGQDSQASLIIEIGQER